MSFRLEKHEGFLTIEGESSGIPYGVRVEPKDRKAEWFEPRPPSKPPSSPPKPGEPCVGCGKNILLLLAEGALGWGKVAFGVDKSSTEKQDARYATCGDCPGQKNVRGFCVACDCLIPLKIMVDGEKCPEGYWES